MGNIRESLAGRIDTAKVYVSFVQEDIGALRMQFKLDTERYNTRMIQLYASLGEAEAIVQSLKAEMTDNEYALVHYQWPTE